MYLYYKKVRSIYFKQILLYYYIIILLYCDIAIYEVVTIGINYYYDYYDLVSCVVVVVENSQARRNTF
jgi:uncharacterized protein YybS (DUF2232 family)